MHEVTRSLAEGTLAMATQELSIAWVARTQVPCMCEQVPVTFSYGI